jgi:hypothetical protein
MNGNASNDESAELRQHPDYERAIRAYSDEEDDRIKAVLLRRFETSLPESLEEAIAEIAEDSEVVETPPGSCGWLYSFRGEKLLLGLLSLIHDKSGITYGFEEY